MSMMSCLSSSLLVLRSLIHLRVISAAVRSDMSRYSVSCVSSVRKGKPGKPIPSSTLAVMPFIVVSIALALIAPSRARSFHALSIASTSPAGHPLQERDERFGVLCGDGKLETMRVADVGLHRLQD